MGEVEEAIDLARARDDRARDAGFDSYESWVAHRGVIRSCSERLGLVPPPESEDDEMLDRQVEFRRKTQEHEAREAVRVRREKIRWLEDHGPSLADGDVERIVDETYQVTAATKLVIDWATAIGGNVPGVPNALVLCGGVGTGKSFAATLAMHKLGGICLRASRLHVALDPWRDETREDDTRMAPGRRGLVVLDDLGTERDAKDPRWAEAFFEFVDARMERGRWTVITSNVSRASFRGRYEDRVLDRLNHSAKVIQIPGASMRRKAGGL